MFKQRRFERDLISEAIRSAVDTVVSEHFGALTQEAQLTSRIAADLEARLNGLSVFDLSIRVIAQEMPDRGRGALEKKSGADSRAPMEGRTSAFGFRERLGCYDL